MCTFATIRVYKLCIRMIKVDRVKIMELNKRLMYNNSKDYIDSSRMNKRNYKKKKFHGKFSQ